MQERAVFVSETKALQVSEDYLNQQDVADFRIHRQVKRGEMQGYTIQLFMNDRTNRFVTEE